MTTVVWCGKTKTLYSDSRSTSRAGWSGSGRNVERDDKVKIFRLTPEDGVFFEEEPVLAVTGSGEVNTINALIQLVVDHGRDFINYAKTLSDTGLLTTSPANVLVVTLTKTVIIDIEREAGRHMPHHQRRISIQVRKHNEDRAIGSGARYYRTLQEVFCLPCETLVHAAIRYDTGSGGDVSRIRVRKGIAVELPRQELMDEDEIETLIKQDLKLRRPDKPDPGYTRSNPVLAHIVHTRKERAERRKKRTAKKTPSKKTPTTSTKKAKKKS